MVLAMWRLQLSVVMQCVRRVVSVGGDMVGVIGNDVARDWHGFEKPAGKCCGLVWGTGTGWVYPTLAKPVPATTGWRVTPEI